MRSVPLKIPPPYTNEPTQRKGYKKINLPEHLKAKLERIKTKKIINKLDRIDEENEEKLSLL